MSWKVLQKIAHAFKSNLYTCAFFFIRIKPQNYVNINFILHLIPTIALFERRHCFAFGFAVEYLYVFVCLSLFRLVFVSVLVSVSFGFPTAVRKHFGFLSGAVGV